MTEPEAAPPQPGRPASVPETSAPLTVAAVARRLGVAAATLRTWDRRYGLGPSSHEAGTHRRYSEQDLSRLAAMRRLTLEGVPPAEAARRALAGIDTPAELGRPVRAGGGRSLALGDAGPAVRGLSRAALTLDSPGVLDLLRRELVDRGTIGWWNDIVVPVLTALGELYARTGEGIDVEHLMSECIISVVAEQSGDPLVDGPVVMLASAEEDNHTLPVRVLAATLTEAGAAVRFLGGRLPAGALANAVRRSRPAAIFLWSSLPTTAGPDQLAGLPSLRPAPRVVVGGPGWDITTLPPDVGHVGSLAEARDALLSTTRGGG